MEESPVPYAFFSENFGLTQESLERILGTALEKKADYADLYFEYQVSESISLDDGLVKNASKNISQGVGVRVNVEERTGYVYSDDISLDRLELAARTARTIADSPHEHLPVSVERGKHDRHDLYPLSKPPVETPLTSKIELLDRIDKICRSSDPRIKNVMASFSCEKKIIFIASSHGWLVGDVQPLCRLNTTCIAEEKGNRQVGTFGGGGRIGFDHFLEERRYERFAREACRQAILNLEATDAPAGTMTVILGPGWPGILLHEAIGHGLEADFNRKKTSAFADRLREKVASELCTVVDDGTIPLRRGSLNIDDEGTPTQRTVLIEKGVLKGYLQDRLNASLLKMPPTGNGRRESFAHIPMPRMTNTFMLEGDSDPAEIIREVMRGLYAVSFGGGQVDITNGKFVFSASEAYLIERGKVTRPVRGATLIGHGPEVLKRVTRVGCDLALDEGVGTCGKQGQLVPVGVGLPTIRIDGITVGGTQS
jgi:TldD protein